MGDIHVSSDSTIFYGNPSDQIFNIFIYSYNRMCLNVPFHDKFSMLENNVLAIYGQMEREGSS